MTFSRLLAQSLVWRGLYFITLFFVNLVLSRYLQAAGSGIVYYISNTFVFIQLVAGLCLENGITYFAAGRRISTNRLLWLCLLWTAILVIAQLVFFHFFPISFGTFSSQQITRYAFCFITGLLLTTYGANLFYASGNFVVSNVILAVFNVLFVLFVLAADSLQNISKETITDVYFYTLFVQGIAVAAACIITNKSWREVALPDNAGIKKFISYSVTVLLFNVLLFFVYRVDYYFVKYSPVCTDADLGNYIQASKLGQMLLVIPQIIGSAVYPQVSSGKEMENVSRIIAWLIKMIALLFVLCFILVLAAGGWLFPFLFGHTFSNVKLPFLILLPGIYGLSLISFLSNYFSGQGNVNISVRAAFMALLIVVSGDFLFVSKYGIVAAALVSMAGYLAMCSPYISRFVKENNLSYKHFFRFGKEDAGLLKTMFGKEKSLPGSNG